MKLRDNASALPLLLTAGVLCATFNVHAQVYKCEANGSVIYQQTPCGTGRGKELNTAPNTMERMAPIRRDRPAASASSPATGSGFDAVAKAQRNGMWEWVDVRKTDRRGYFCVSDSYKLDPRTSLPRSYGGNCNVPRDTVSGGRFELQVQCVLGSSGDKEFGKMVMTMSGTATPTQIDISFFPQPSGTHSRLAVLGEQVRTEATERWTWIRPCRPEEAPGPQWKPPADAPKPTPQASAPQPAPRVAAAGRTDEVLPAHVASLYALADRSYIEALGVFKATAGSNPPNTIDVRVRRSNRPLVLVLSSGEPVRWNLVLEPGAELSAVLISGNNGQVIAGAGGVRVIELGKTNAYKNDQLPPLQRELTQKIGRPADRFQGQYEASSFSVGGTPDSVAKQDKYGIGTDSVIAMLGAVRTPASEPVHVNVADVRVRRSARPVVLVLSSNVGVRWNISLDPGAELRAVFTAGSAAQSVTGVNRIPIKHLGFERPVADAQAHEKAVEQEIGRRIDMHPQRFLGDKPRSFEVGGE